MNNKILTRPGYWNNLQNSTKNYWRGHTKYGDYIVCTHRPNLREYKGQNKLRRCSTGGRWGKSADIVGVNVEKLIRDGYVFVD